MPGHRMLESGAVEAIVSSASACALAIKEYAHALATIPRMPSARARVSALARDLSELLPALAPAIKKRLRAVPQASCCFSRSLHAAARSAIARHG